MEVILEFGEANVRQNECSSGRNHQSKSRRGLMLDKGREAN
jgi:hypothetical protein